MFLKRNFGSGYTVTFEVGSSCSVSRLTERIHAFVPNAALVHTTEQELGYILPADQKTTFYDLFNDLESKKVELGINGFGISATSLEEVFLNVAVKAEQKSAKRLKDANAAAIPITSDPESPNIDLISASTGLAQTSGLYTGPLVEDFSLWWQRFCAIIRKRFQHARHDQKALLSQVAMPALFVVVGMFVATAFPPSEDLPKMKLHGTAPLRQICPLESDQLGANQAVVKIPYADMVSDAYSEKLHAAVMYGDSWMTELEAARAEGEAGSDRARRFVVLNSVETDIYESYYDLASKFWRSLELLLVTFLFFLLLCPNNIFFFSFLFFSFQTILSSTTRRQRARPIRQTEYSARSKICFPICSTLQQTKTGIVGQRCRLNGRTTKVFL